MKSQFEQSFETHINTTTIAPNPKPGSTLKADGWRFVIRDGNYEIIGERDPDVERQRIWRAFGHKR